MISRKSIAVAVCLALVFCAPLAMAEKTEKKDKKRAKIDTRASEILETVLGESENAQELFDKAMGYAVFDNTKVTIGISGGGGKGVAVNKGSDTRTYMKMGTAGVALGIGAKTYSVIMLFENEKVFDNFVTNGWQADTQAGAAAGSKGVAAKTTFHNGMAVFVHTKAGLMASADVSGTKYWKSDLND